MSIEVGVREYLEETKVRIDSLSEGMDDSRINEIQYDKLYLQWNEAVDIANKLTKILGGSITDNG